MAYQHPLGFTEKQVNALWESAWHWLENWEDPQDASYDAEDCACCALSNSFLSCRGCPIYDYTGIDTCYYTPYHGAVKEIRSFERLFYFSDEVEVEEKKNYLSKKKIEREYQFLVMLALGEHPKGYCTVG